MSLVIDLWGCAQYRAAESCCVRPMFSSSYMAVLQKNTLVKRLKKENRNVSRQLEKAFRETKTNLLDVKAALSQNSRSGSSLQLSRKGFPAVAAVCLFRLLCSPLRNKIIIVSFSFRLSLFFSFIYV